MKNLVLFFLLFTASGVFGQYNLKSLVGEGRPPLENPNQFARDLKNKAIDIVQQRLGKNYFSVVDTSYRYPHYYDNVYFNSAPSEMNYRVFFRLFPATDHSYSFELEFDAKTLELLYPISAYLPDCSKNGKSCSIISSSQVMQTGKEKQGNGFKREGNLHFSYDAKRKSFIWTYSNRELQQYPYGIEFIMTMDAVSGKVISATRNEKVYMGR